jgi:hypothetical protein
MGSSVGVGGESGKVPHVFLGGAGTPLAADWRRIRVFSKRAPAQGMEKHVIFQTLL